MKKIRPGYQDRKGVIMEGFAGGAIICEGIKLPANTTGGFRPGCLFFLRVVDGANPAGVYKNTGSYTSCTFGQIALMAVTADGPHDEVKAIGHEEVKAIEDEASEDKLEEKPEEESDEEKPKSHKRKWGH